MPASLDLEFQWRGRRFKQASQGLEAFAGSILPVEAAGPAVSRVMREFLSDLAGDMAQLHGRPWPGGTSPGGARPGRLSRRSGRLLRSIKESVRVTGDLTREIEGRIGSDEPYARIQERGGVVRAKRAKYLTIPLPAALNSDGTPKRRSAREWDNTFVIKSRNQNLLIVQKKGKDLVPLYVLKKQVTIPPRLGLGFALQGGAEAFAEVIIQTVLQEILKGKPGAA